MKLLLTSSGLSNKSIVSALNDLTDKSPNDVAVAYIPIAANAQAGNKDWVIKDFLNLWRYGYNNIDMVDPTAAGVDWQTRLAAADVIQLSGGNTFHLLDQTRKTGLDKWLIANKENKIYVGGSAGAILFTPSIEIASLEYGDENLPGLRDLTGLNIVSFEIAPHVPTWCPYETIEKYANKKRQIIYAIDDQSAIKVSDSGIEVISEGQWRVFNEK